MRQFTEYILVNPFIASEKEQAKILTKWVKLAIKKMRMNLVDEGAEE
ncbi:MAG: hypothetical protein QXP29_07360 [Candidatus Nezhaarchaeales archaeon]